MRSAAASSWISNCPYCLPSSFPESPDDLSKNRSSVICEESLGYLRINLRKFFAMAMRDWDEGEEILARDVVPASTDPYACREGVTIERFEHIMQQLGW